VRLCGCASVAVAEDPGERINVVADPANAVRLESMLARLEVLATEMVEPMQWAPPWQGPDYAGKDYPPRPPSHGPQEPWTSWIVGDDSTQGFHVEV
jgi:hypothetical protein